MDTGAASEGGCEGGWTQVQPVGGGVRVDGHRGGQWCVCVCVCVCVRVDGHSGGTEQVNVSAPMKT